MAEFIKGRILSRRFFNEIAKPVLDEYFPTLQYSAGLLGYGSDVLGFDDATSTDHMWGPRFYLFLNESDISKRDTIMEVFSHTLPYTFLGYSVHFSAPDPNDCGVRHAEFISEGPVSPLIFIHTPEEYLTDYLGTAFLHDLSAADWLCSRFPLRNSIKMTCIWLNPFPCFKTIQKRFGCISLLPTGPSSLKSRRS